MNSQSFLPREIAKVGVPPLKCQGIKTKLVPFIAQSIRWEGNGVWIEPFLGSGVVAFNVCPKDALLTDTNRHIVQFYLDLRAGVINQHVVRDYLIETGNKLAKRGQDFYYEIRDEFNGRGGSLRLLFLNRCCFNGVMRFNRRGHYNVPFGHKPERFTRSYITKIANQVQWAQSVLRDRDWRLEVADWSDPLAKARPGDFVYMDPPYIGRHADYYNTWSERDALKLSAAAGQLPCRFAVSMWKANKYRSNGHLDTDWQGCSVKTFRHFYHIGSKEAFRNEMTEALAGNALK
jgi:DNA adenine methylase